MRQKIIGKDVVPDIENCAGYVTEMRNSNLVNCVYWHQLIAAIYDIAQGDGVFFKQHL